MENTEKLWKQYDQHISTYKFYLEVLVKLMTMFFAVTGAMISFYFTKSEISTAKLALYLPLIMSIGLFLFFVIGVVLSTVTRKDVFKLRDKLELEVSPELGVLTLLLAIFAIVTLACSVGLGYVLWF